MELPALAGRRVQAQARDSRPTRRRWSHAASSSMWAAAFVSLLSPSSLQQPQPEPQRCSAHADCPRMELCTDHGRNVDLSVDYRCSPCSLLTNRFLCERVAIDRDCCSGEFFLQCPRLTSPFNGPEANVPGRPLRAPANLYPARTLHHIQTRPASVQATKSLDHCRKLCSDSLFLHFRPFNKVSSSIGTSAARVARQPRQLWLGESGRFLKFTGLCRWPCSERRGRRCGVAQHMRRQQHDAGRQRFADRVQHATAGHGALAATVSQ